MTDRIAAKQPSLRHTDWRFLLPMPDSGIFQHLVLLGGQPGLAERIHEMGLARRVSCDIPPIASADALVVLKDGYSILNRSVQCLAPAGVLYCEIDRLSRSTWFTTPNRLKNALKTFGVVITSTYAVRPSFQSREVYLPLDVPNALRWYIKTLYVARTPAHRLLELGLQLVTRLNHNRFAKIAPFFAVTGVMGPTRAVVPMSLEGIPSQEESQRHPIRPVILTPGEDGGNRATVLVFPYAAMQPTMVLKIPKLPEFNARTKNEQRTLAKIRLFVDADGLRSIPEPHGFKTMGGLVISHESYMQGSSLARISGSFGVSINRKLDSLLLAADWLAKFHEKTEIERPLWSSALASQWVETPLQLYHHVFDINHEEAHLFNCMNLRASELAGLPFPLVWQHRDFNVWNIFQAGRDINVIDWEGGRIGPGVCDLLHFVTHWNEAVRHLNTTNSILRGFRELFCERPYKNKTHKTINTLITQYMNRLGVDRRFFPLLLVYTWVELALRRFDQQQAMGQAKTEHRDGNRFVEYVGVLAQNADYLFGAPLDDDST